MLVVAGRSPAMKSAAADGGLQRRTELEGEEGNGGHGREANLTASAVKGLGKPGATRRRRIGDNGRRPEGLKMGSSAAITAV